MDQHKRSPIHAYIFAFFSLLILYILHALPINQIFIDPFSEAIRQYDVMDIAFSQFRNHDDPRLFDERVIVINSGLTDRQKVAQALELLNEKSASAVGLDLLFDTCKYTKKDTVLRLAIQKMPQLVMGYSFSESRGKHAITTGIASHEFFTKNVRKGHVNLATNDGFSVRAFQSFYQKEDSTGAAFSVNLAQLMDPKIIGDLKDRKHKLEWINFKRVQPGQSSMIFPINSKSSIQYTVLNIDEFIRDSALYDKNFFQDKLVLIGFSGENDLALSMQDRYFTPLNEKYTGRSKPDMHGVIIHANIISMLLDRDFINDLPAWVMYVLIYLIFLWNYYLFVKILNRNSLRRVFAVRLFQIFEFLILLIVSILILVKNNIKLEFFTLATVVIISFELFELYDHRFRIWIDDFMLIRKNKKSERQLAATPAPFSDKIEHEEE